MSRKDSHLLVVCSPGNDAIPSLCSDVHPPPANIPNAVQGHSREHLIFWLGGVWVQGGHPWYLMRDGFVVYGFSSAVSRLLKHPCVWVGSLVLKVSKAGSNPCVVSA